MNFRFHLSLFLFALALWGPGDRDACAQTNTNAAPALPSTTLPASELKVRAGLRMELVAGGNLVESPAAMAFDERGRLFVAELRDYPASRSGQTLSGRVRLLEDSDGDGVFDTSVVFADDLDRPSAIVCSRGGVFVAGPSKLSFLLDVDGDGIADVNRTLLNFRSSSPPESLDQFPRSMKWGPDRRIYVALPSADAEVLNPNAPGQRPLKLYGGGFSFDPLTMKLRAETGAAATGQAFDDAGHRFLCSPSAILAVTVLNTPEAGRNPYAPLMPTSAVLVSAPRNGAPLNCLIYRGNRYPTNLQGQAFLADPVSCAIYQVALREGETHPTAVARAGTVLVPCVESADTSFRPMELVTGPDDYLYIADLARERYPGGRALSTHPEGDEVGSTGRIWQLVPAGEAAGAARAPDFSSVLGLATALGNSNAWIRGTAARLLLEHRPTNAAPALREVLTWARWPVARLEALRSLNAAGAATGRDLARAVGDPDASMRAAAIGMAGAWLAEGRLAGSLGNLLQTHSRDASGEVRLRLALALGSVRRPPPSAMLVNLYTRDTAEVWMRRALLTVAPETMTPLFIELLSRPRVCQSPSGRALLLDLATSIGLGGERPDVSNCLRALEDLNVPAGLAYPVVAALAQGVEGRGLRLPDVDEQGLWPGIANTAQSVAVGGGDEQIRSEAVRVLGACASSNLVADTYLLLMFAPGLPVGLQIPVIQALAQQGLDRDFEALTQRWHLWAPPEQQATLDALLQSDRGAEALLSALASQTIPVGGLTSVQINLLRGYPADGIRARAERLFGSRQPDRSALVSDFLGALDLQGSVANGRELFNARCASCHWSGPRSLGPSLGEMQSRSAIQLVAGLIDPSREIEPGYETAIFKLSQGHLAWGVARDVNAQVIQLTTPAGRRRYLRGAVGSINRTDWSLMPDNTAAGLSRQNVADLVRFIRAGGDGR